MQNVYLNKTTILQAHSASSVQIMLSTKDLREPRSVFSFSQNRIIKKNIIKNKEYTNNKEVMKKLHDFLKTISCWIHIDQWIHFIHIE